MKSLGIIGYGNMGEAFALGLKSASDWKVSVFEKFSDSAEKAKSQGFAIPQTLSELVNNCEILLIAIKPQDIPGLLAELKPMIKNHGIISVAAGLKTSYFQENLGTKNVVRFMPNLAAKEGKALVAVTSGSGCPPDFEKDALLIAAAGGVAAQIPEKLMSAITGLSGSGIAFVFHFIHALAMGGVREGFPYQKSLEYALTTIDGAIALLKATGDHPIAFESRVTSPAGTTVEGVKVLESAGFTGIVMDAVSAASRRASELE